MNNRTPSKEPAPGQQKRVNDLSGLTGRSVKIRFSVQNADLYSFWFEEIGK